jgi:uncharacterized membrane protein
VFSTADGNCFLDKKQKEDAMETIEKSIEVECPLRTVYNQWTQFEEFPRFMQGVKKVTQLDDQRLHWEAEIGGKNKEWDAKAASTTLVL